MKSNTYNTNIASRQTRNMNMKRERKLNYKEYLRRIDLLIN